MAGTADAPTAGAVDTRRTAPSPLDPPAARCGAVLLHALIVVLDFALLAPGALTGT